LEGTSAVKIVLSNLVILGSCVYIEPRAQSLYMLNIVILPTNFFKDPKNIYDLRIAEKRSSEYNKEINCQNKMQ